MRAADIEKKTEEFLLPILERMGFELVDVEYVKEAGEYFLRAYIDKEGGININDCVDVSREMNEILDREDYIADAYTFEVSSPGLTRPLKKDRDYDRNIGRPIEAKTYAPFEGRKDFAGILKEYTKDTVTIEEDNQVVTLNRKDLSMIRQAFVD